MEATLLDSMSNDVEVRTPAQKRLAAMHGEDRPAFFGWLANLLADTEKSPGLRQAASVAMKQAMAAARPAPPPSKRWSKRGQPERMRPRQQTAQRRKKHPSADTTEDPNDLKGLFAMLQGSVGSDEQMLKILQDTVTRSISARAAQKCQSTLPRVSGALVPVHQLQLELIQTLATKERQASYLRSVGKQVQDEQLLEKLSLTRAQRTGFDAVGTVASVRSPRRHRKPPTKPVTADEAFALALSERQQQRPSATVSTWSARDARNPHVREWLLNKQLESASPETLELVNWILILTRRGEMTEQRLRYEMARHGPIPSAWLRQIRDAMRTVAYSQRLQQKRHNRDPSPPRERAGVLEMSIQSVPIGLLHDSAECSTPQREEAEAEARSRDAVMQSVESMDLHHSG